MNDKRVTLRMPVALHDTLSQLAETENTTINAILIQAAKTYIRFEQTKRVETSAENQLAMWIHEIEVALNAIKSFTVKSRENHD